MRQLSIRTGNYRNFRDALFEALVQSGFGCEVSSDKFGSEYIEKKEPEEGIVTRVTLSNISGLKAANIFIAARFPRMGHVRNRAIRQVFPDDKVTNIESDIIVSGSVASIFRAENLPGYFQKKYYFEFADYLGEEKKDRINDLASRILATFADLASPAGIIEELLSRRGVLICPVDSIFLCNVAAAAAMGLLDIEMSELIRIRPSLHSFNYCGNNAATFFENVFQAASSEIAAQNS